MRSLLWTPDLPYPLSKQTMERREDPYAHAPARGLHSPLRIEEERLVKTARHVPSVILTRRLPLVRLSQTVKMQTPRLSSFAEAGWNECLGSNAAGDDDGKQMRQRYCNLVKRRDEKCGFTDGGHIIVGTDDTQETERVTRTDNRRFQNDGQRGCLNSCSPRGGILHDAKPNAKVSLVGRSLT
jgi:hypothetical protein